MLSDFMKEIPSGHSTRGGCSLPYSTPYTHTEHTGALSSGPLVASQKDNMSSFEHSNRIIRNRNEEDGRTNTERGD